MICLLSKLYERQTIICTFLFGLTFRSERARESLTAEMTTAATTSDTMGNNNLSMILISAYVCVCLFVFVSQDTSCLFELNDKQSISRMNQLYYQFIC